MEESSLFLLNSGLVLENFTALLEVFYQIVQDLF